MPISCNANVQWIFFGGLGLLGVLLVVSGVVVGLERRGRRTAWRKMGGEDDLEDPPFSEEARELVASEFTSLTEQVKGRREEGRDELPAADRLAALEEKKGPMPEFIRDLFKKD